MSRRWYSGLSSGQRSKIIDRFMAVTQQSAETSERVLQAHNYQLERALEHYYMYRGRYPIYDPPTPSQGSLDKLDRLFNRYAGNDDKDSTSPEGLALFFKDIGIDLAHRWTLMIAFKLQASELAKFKRKEFQDGFSKMWVFTLKEIKKVCEKECRSIEKSEKQFSEFYSWLFTHVKENENKRSIPKELAIQLWDTVLSKEEHPLINDLSSFITNSTETKSITMDTWINIRKFLKECTDPFKFENDGAWPILVDQYLEATELQNKRGTVSP